jgi:competence protein ComEC
MLRFDTLPLNSAQAQLRDAIFETFYAQKDRLILWLPVLFALGVGGYFTLKFEPPFILSGCLSFFSVLSGMLLFKYKGRSLMRYLSWLLVTAIALIIGGFTIAQYRTITLDTVMLTKKISPVEITGTIIDIDQLEGDDGSRIILSDLVIERLEPEMTPQKVRIKVKWDQNLKINQRVQLFGALNPPSAPVAPRAFDFQRYAYFQGIGGFGFAFKEPVLLDSAPQTNIKNRLEALRQTIAKRITQNTNEPATGIAIALMSGERTSIPEDIWDDMRDSGMAHMLAISGLHVGMIAGVIFFFTRLLLVFIPGFAEQHPVKKYAAVAAIIAAFFYMIIVGSTIPTQRAMLMTSIIMLAIILDRKAFSMRLVAITALIVLLLTPEALWSASFQMSFAAVTGLIFFYDSIRNFWSQMHRNASWLRRIGLYIMGVSMTTLIATFATAPFALFHFQQLSIYSLFANLIGVPIMAFIVMPLTAFSYLAMALHIDGPFLWVMEQGIQLILSIAHHVANIESATWNPPSWPLSALLSFVFAALFFMLVKGRLRYLSVILIAVGAIMITNHRPPDILVSSSGKLIAYKNAAQQLSFNSRVSDRFSSDIWIRRHGQEEKPKWPYQNSEHEKFMNCDDYGCHLEKSGYKIAFSKHPQSHASDCHQADILIAEDPVFVKPCAADIKIDKFYLWRNGATALWLMPDRVEIETVNSIRGTRPWTISPRR